MSEYIEARSEVPSAALTYSTIPVTTVTTCLQVLVKKEEKFKEVNHRPEDGEEMENRSIQTTAASSEPSTADSAATETVKSSSEDQQQPDYAQHRDIDDLVTAYSSARQTQAAIFREQEQRIQVHVAENAWLRSELLRKYDSNEAGLLHVISGVILIIVLSMLIYSCVSQRHSNSASPRVLGWVLGCGLFLSVQVISRIIMAVIATPKEVKASKQRWNIWMNLLASDLVGQGSQMMCCCGLLVNATMMLSSRVAGSKNNLLLLTFGLLLGLIAIVLQVLYTFWKTSSEVEQKKLTRDFTGLFCLGGAWRIGLFIVFAPFFMPFITNYDNPDAISTQLLGVDFGLVSAGGLGWFIMQRWVFGSRRCRESSGVLQQVCFIELETPELEARVLGQTSRTLSPFLSSESQPLNTDLPEDLPQQASEASNMNRLQAGFLWTVSLVQLGFLLFLIVCFLLLNLIPDAPGPLSWSVPSTLYASVCFLTYFGTVWKFRQQLLSSEIASNRVQFLGMDVFSGFSRCSCFALLCLFVTSYAKTRHVHLLLLSAALIFQLQVCEMGFMVVFKRVIDRSLDGLQRQDLLETSRDWLKAVAMLGVIASLSAAIVGPTLFFGSDVGRFKSILPCFLIVSVPYWASAIAKLFFVVKFSREESWIDVAALLGMRPRAPLLQGHDVPRYG